MKPVIIQKGEGPIILGQPHCGTYIPDEITDQLNDFGHQLSDTDWHVDQLYDGLLGSASIVRANFHRYVIDANRDPSGKSLYPGENTTGLVPLVDFENRPIWKTDPDADEVERRRKMFHAAYHKALSEEIDRVKSTHGIAIVFDCHSIRSELPFLFDGKLPDLNIGTNDGATCSAEIEDMVSKPCADTAKYSYVVNGRFKGGWTTRNYGRPAAGVHAIQMEIAQRCYLACETSPFLFDEKKAEHLRGLLGQILRRLEGVARSGKIEWSNSCRID